MPSLIEHVQAFERYMETSTTLLPRTRARYAYEVGLFARVMGISTLEEITPALLLEWNAILHDAGGATHIIWGNYPPCRAVTFRERSALGNTAAWIASTMGE
jgi:hypothetical protein